MTIELAHSRLIAKPWGTSQLAPWDTGPTDGSRIGEICYERSGNDTIAGLLQFKLLFATEQVAVKVSPNDEQAKSLGLASGRTAAWYILSATPQAQVAIGLNRTLTAAQLHKAATDGSLAKMIKWRSVWAGETVFLPAGTIHTMSAGIVAAEIQQRNGPTFRLLDTRTDRELHVEQGVTVACADLGPEQPRARQISDQRTLLVRDQHFIFERVSLPTGSHWSLKADRETWVLVINGGGTIGSFEVRAGQAVFASSERAAIIPSAGGLTCLIGYLGGKFPDPDLLTPTA